MSIRFWRTLLEHLWREHARRFDTALRWKGLRVFCLDGTGVRLPNVPAVRAGFPCHSTGKGQGRAPLARVVAAVSAFTGYCRAFTFTAWSFGEHAALKHLARAMGPGDLLLLDRGFFSAEGIKALGERGLRMLLRITGQTAGHCRTIAELDGDDHLVEVKCLPGVILRRIRYQIPGFRESWLLTNLTDALTFPAPELVGVYHWRWRIETVVREWKRVLSMQNLRAHTPAGLSKELHAHMLLSNLVRQAMSEAVEDTPLTPVQVSFTAAINGLRAGLAATGVCLPLGERWLVVIRAAVIRQRPGRTYPRRRDGKIRHKGGGKTVLPHRLPASES